MRERERAPAVPASGEASRPRLLVPALAACHEGEEIVLSREEAAHIRSRRLRDGEEVVTLDGKGARARARLTRHGAAVALLAFERNSGPGSLSSPSAFASLPGEPSLRVTVLLACAEPARVEWAVEKGTECGAAAFVLMDVTRSQRAHVAALRTRLVRLTRIAAEATKQCDRTIVPDIEGPVKIGCFLRGEEGRGARRRPLFLADPSGAPLEEKIASLSDSSSVAGGVAVAIGPEGGFTPDEISLFEGSGALRVSLGSRILRLETAVVAALTLLVGGR